MKLGEKIYQARKKLGMSQETLAMQVGVSRQAVSKWETGETEPEIAKLRALSEVLGVSADWLLDETEAACDTEQTTELAETQRVEHTWVDLLPKTIQTLIKQYRWLAGVRMAVSGALFIAMGLVGKAIARSMEAMSGGFLTSEIVMDGMENVMYKAPTNPLDIMLGFIIAIGVIALIGGVLLAVMLKKKD